MSRLRREIAALDRAAEACSPSEQISSADWTLRDERDRAIAVGPRAYVEKVRRRIGGARAKQLKVTPPLARNPSGTRPRLYSDRVYLAGRRRASAASSGGASASTPQ